MHRARLSSFVAAVAFAAPLVGCGPNVDLATSLKVVDVISGYHDAGVIKDGPQAGWSHILPSVTFKLKNEGTEPISGVRLMVSFWADGDDADKDSRELSAIGSDALAPGASTDAITVRSNVGYNLEAPRTELFNQSMFRDWTAKFFAKRSGRIVPIGAFKIDRRLLPHERFPNRP
jgi:hypothetical protein